MRLSTAALQPVVLVLSAQSLDVMQSTEDERGIPGDSLLLVRAGAASGDPQQPLQ